MPVFSFHRTTDTVKLKKTLEWAGSGAEVSEAVAHCHRGQMETARITFVLNTLAKKIKLNCALPKLMALILSFSQPALTT